MNTLFCIDIDATISDASWRNKLAGPEPSRKDWPIYLKWLKKVQNKKMLMLDTPVPGMNVLCHLIKENAVYITARQTIYRDVTEKWLKKHGFPILPLYMRPKNCVSSAGKYKERVIKSLLKNNKKQVIIFDDDPKGCLFNVCKKNGWILLKAMSGS